MPGHHQLHLWFYFGLKDDVVNFIKSCSLKNTAVPLKNLIPWEGGRSVSRKVEPGGTSGLRAQTGEAGGPASSPGLRCPTVSARLPLFTLVMKAQRRPDSVIFPPTTCRRASVRNPAAAPRWFSPEAESHLKPQQRSGIRGNRPVFHPLIQEDPSNQTLSILGRLPGDRLLARDDNT